MKALTDFFVGDFETLCPHNVNIHIRIPFCSLVPLTLHSIILAVSGCLITIAVSDSLLSIPKSVVPLI